MAYAVWSVVFGEQPSAAKWNILGTNDSGFNDGSGFAAGAIGATPAAIAAGIVVQVVSTAFTAVATGTTVIPFDDTIPQITEGDQYMTQAITPKSATNILVIEVYAMVSSTISQRMIGGIWQDATANALAAFETFTASSQTCAPHSFAHTMTSGTTSSTTFRYRAGTSSAGTTTFNGVLGARSYGAITKSVMKITEIKV